MYINVDEVKFLNIAQILFSPRQQLLIIDCNKLLFDIKFVDIKKLLNSER